jgi:HEAT repeat protein
MRYCTAAMLVAVLGLCVGFESGEAGGKKDKGKISKQAPRSEEVPKYLRLLDSSSARDRALAAEMLGLRGLVNANDVDPAAIDPLKKMAQQDSAAEARKAAVLALGNIHPEAKDTVPVLVEVVKTDKAMDVKLAATVALGQFGADAKEALPALRDLGSKFDNKKSQEFQTVQASIKLITGKGKK